MFRQIAQTLEDQILSGAHPPGSRLPTEAELAARFGVSRHTLREALAELRRKGLIESRQGIGSVVRRAAPATRHVETYSSIHDLTRHARGTPIRVDRVEDIVADAALAARLDGIPGQGYIRIEGVRCKDNDPARPIGHVVVHVDVAYGRIREAAWRLDRSIVETLEGLYGLRVARIAQEVSATALSPEIAARLDAQAGAPALLIRRRYLDESGRSFEGAESTFPMDRFVYRSELTL
jgi:DNA-binding GntR family transcriptional regulator